MLKIKDNYDLNNLKKYGFKHEKGMTLLSSWDFWELNLNWAECNIATKDRVIDFFNFNEDYICNIDDLDVLYDMIQDGIVEKESEV